MELFQGGTDDDPGRLDRGALLSLKGLALDHNIMVQILNYGSGDLDYEIVV